MPQRPCIVRAYTPKPQLGSYRVIDWANCTKPYSTPCTPPSQRAGQPCKIISTQQVSPAAILSYMPKCMAKKASPVRAASSPSDVWYKTNEQPITAAAAKGDN